MDSGTTARNTAKYPIGPLVCEGKTKQVYEIKGKPGLALVISKDDITAGDGAKHDLIKGKAGFATTTTCNVFEFLKAAGIPVAFIERDNDNSFVAAMCQMLPYEVVVRREAHGSYLKRYPGFEKGHRFDDPFGEYFLKTKDRTWKGTPLICDDPLIMFGLDGEIRLHDPTSPNSAPFLELNESLVFTQNNEHQLLDDMYGIALRTFLILEEAWAKQDGRLVDFKVEFGIGPEGQLLLADVIDNDSWRVVMGNSYVDKQVYRDGGDLVEVAAKYLQVAQATSRFNESA